MKCLNLASVASLLLLAASPLEAMASPSLASPPASAQLLPDELGSQLAYMAESLQPKGDCDRDKIPNSDDEDLDGDGTINEEYDTVECRKKDNAGWIVLGTFGTLVLLMYDNNNDTVSP